jgi:hypothetical protein
MTPEKILTIVAIYEKRLLEEKIFKIRIDPKRTFASLSKEEILSHAYYLIDGIKEYIKTPNKEGKACRHLASVQMCLSFAGWYSLEDLINHNRP